MAIENLSRFFLLIVSAFIFSSALKAQGILDDPRENTFSIDEQTAISFSVAKNNFYYSNEIDASINISQLKDINFSSYSNFTGFKAYKFYLQKIQIENSTKTVKTISVIPGRSHLKSEFFLLSKNHYKSFKNTPGTNSNNLSSINPKKTSPHYFESRNFTFKLNAGEVAELYYKFQMSNKAHFMRNALEFNQTEKYEENRRFGLWLEGVILGSILGLLIFTFYSYFQIRDRTTLYFGLWLITAFFAVIGQNHHDGTRLLEFFIYPLEDNPFFSSISFAGTIDAIAGYGQAMMFVIFARNFINLKKYHPTAFKFTNIYLYWYAFHFFFFRVFDFEIDINLVWYSLIFSTVLVLLLLFYFAVKRYQSGMNLAKFFIIGFLPYFIFRIFHLLGILGFDSPFSYLPDSGIQYFLNSQATQSLGLFLEAIIMSLVLAKRTKFLQDELNENIQEQADEAKKQKIVLEETVQQRTSELQEKNIVMEAISNKLAKYIPPQIHEALFAGKVDAEIKTRRRKLTVFFSDIKNFTSTSENMQPEDLTKYLNEYFSEMTIIAVNHGATIDKYIGDSMMVFFGDPETRGEKEDAKTCVVMALEMQDRMKELREKWSQEGFAEPFEIRMGVNTGYCNVGNFGSDQRLTYTIIGGEVNVAARLESVAEVNGLYLSYETYVHVQDMVHAEQKEAIKMKGINRDIRIYSVKGRNEEAKEKTKVSKVTKSTKKELSDIEKLKEESKLLRDETKGLKESLATIKLELNKLINQK